MSEDFEMNIDEIEKYIISKKVKDMSLEEIRDFIEAQGNTIIINHHVYEKNQQEIERLQNIIKEAQNYLRSTTHFILDYDKPWTKISKEEEQYTKRESDLRRILKGEKVDWLILNKGDDDLLTK